MDFANLSQPNIILDTYPIIERDFYTVDGHTLLQVDSYPQESIQINIASGFFESSFKPPLFKDDTESGFNLFDPMDPSRLVYFTVKG